MDLMNRILEKFRSGEKPNGEDFELLIKNSFNDNVEVYTQEGMQTRTVKMFVGMTTVTGNMGNWSIDYSNVGYKGVVMVVSTPIQNGDVSVITDAYLASVVKDKNNTSANGFAFNAAVQGYGGTTQGVALARVGTPIQIMVIGY